MASDYAESPPEGQTCRHHWVIEPANGPWSMGECRLCGERRSFTNNPDALPLRSEVEPRRYVLKAN